jgi:hypothetical protein
MKGDLMDFQAAESQYRCYSDQCSQGKITYQQFLDAVNKITVYDQTGQLWMLHAQSAKWCVYRSGQWVFMDPPSNTPINPVQAAHIPSPQITPVANYQPGIPPVSVYQMSSQPKKKSPLLLILGIVVFICGGIAITGIMLTKSGSFSSLLSNLPFQTTNPKPSAPVEGKFTLDPVETVTIGGGQSVVVDSNQATLQIPIESLPAGVNGKLTVNEPNNALKKEIGALATLVTPFYQVKLEGENDGSGMATFSLPTNGDPLFLIELFDGKFMAASPIEYSGSNASIQVPLYSGLTDAGDSSFSFQGTYAFAFITPLQASIPHPEVKLASQKKQTDPRDCTIRYQFNISGYGAQEIKNPTSFCRKNGNDTIRVMYNTTYTPKMTTDNADQVVDIIQKIMASYQTEGFTAANLEKNGTKVNVIVEAGSGDPVYTPSNGTVYIPMDSIGGDNISSELAHELAHWVQDASYNMTSSYWSDKLGISSTSKWWLENSAEDMVMLYDPAYIDKNLTYYGTTSLGNDKRTPFQLAPNQWNDDLYNHAQVLKVFTCDNPSVCAISPSKFVEAINNGTFPIDSAALDKMSQHLDEYARYLLGKSPQSANSAIFLMNGVKNGTGYGETVTPVSDKSTLTFKKTGYEPQMKLSSGDSGNELDIQARIEKGGVYPLMVESPINVEMAGNPVEIVVEAGTPFYYIEDKGEIKFSDGTSKIILGPIHPKAGISGLRIVAVATDGEKNFTAKIRTIDITGDWMFAYKNIISNSMVCDQTGVDDPMTPEEIAQLTSYINSYVTTIAGVFTRDTGTNAYTWTISPGADLSFDSDTTAVVNGAALVDGKGVTVQTSVSVPESTSFTPPIKGLPVALASSAFLGICLLWKGKKYLRIPMAFLALLLISGCSAFFYLYGDFSTSTLIDQLLPPTPENEAKVFGAEQGAAFADYHPKYLVSGETTADVNFTMGAGAVTTEGTDEGKTVCSGTIVYRVNGFLLDDGVITDFPGSD